MTMINCYIVKNLIGMDNFKKQKINMTSYCLRLRDLIILCKHMILCAMLGSPHQAIASKSELVHILLDSDIIIDVGSTASQFEINSKDDSTKFKI